MGQRSMWKGALKLGLVSVPVRMINASEPVSKQRVSFNKLHAKCNGRVRSKDWCPACNMELQSDDKVRGYEYAKGQYVVIGDADLQACEAQASPNLELQTVTDEVIEPVFVDSMAYLVADGPGAAQAFETLRQALRGRRAIGTMVKGDTDLQVAIEPTAASAFTVYLLRPRSTIRTVDDLETVPAVAPSKNDVKLATMLLDQLEGTFDYEEVHDTYTDRVREMIQAKVEGRAPAAAPKATPAATASTLQDMLEQSLAMQAKLPKKAGKTVKATVRAHTPKRAAR